MRTNQRGVSLVGVLSIIAVVGLLGAAGWFVYDSRYNEGAATLSQPKTIAIPPDWQWFMSQDGSIEFAYPKSWGDLVEKTENTYDTNSFIGRVTIRSKKDFLTQIHKGYTDYTWYKWNEDSDSLASAVDTEPPSEYNTPYERPVTLGAMQDLEPIFEASKGRAIYEVLGKGAMNCGTHHYFFSVKDKVVHLPAGLCDRAGEWEPQEGQAYEDEVVASIKDFYKYIQD